jgi:hypothetical protein
LLLFAPFYRALFLRNNPGVTGLTDKEAEEALLFALRQTGHLKDLRTEDGTLRLESTDVVAVVSENLHLLGLQERVSEDTTRPTRWVENSISV